MRIHYDIDTNIVEVFFETTANYADEIDDDTLVFKAENDDRIVGYSFDNADKTAFENNLLSAKQKLAILLKIVRTDMNLTQEVMAQNLENMQLRQYQRLESGTENTTLDTVDNKVRKNLPDVDFSRIFLTNKAS